MYMYSRGAPCYGTRRAQGPSSGGAGGSSGSSSALVLEVLADEALSVAAAHKSHIKQLLQASRALAGGGGREGVHDLGATDA